MHAEPIETARALLATAVSLALIGTLRGLRDRAILLLGFAGGLRRSEFVGLDAGREHTLRAGLTSSPEADERTCKGGSAMPRPR